MGAFLSKVAPTKSNVEGVRTPTGPTAPETSTPNKFLDPRSPNPFRTPISNLPFNDAKPVSRAQNLTTDDTISTTTTVTPTKLKNKLLRDLGYTLDPRSPALNFDRTPITFNDSNVTDDFSFAGLSLNESDAQTPAKEQQDEIFFTPVQDKCAQSTIDPRSPSVDIERTPLTLNVLDDTLEKETPPEHVDEEEAKTPTEENTVASVITGNVKNLIYMDENQEQPMTPTSLKSGPLDKIEKVRTPLSCLINTQGTDIRNEKRLKMTHQTNLGRAIFKETTVNHTAVNKMSTSSSKIPVLRKSLSKEIN